MRGGERWRPGGWDGTSDGAEPASRGADRPRTRRGARRRMRGQGGSSASLRRGPTRPARDGGRHVGRRRIERGTRRPHRRLGRGQRTCRERLDAPAADPGGRIPGVRRRRPGSWPDHPSLCRASSTHLGNGEPRAAAPAPAVPVGFLRGVRGRYGTASRGASPRTRVAARARKLRADPALPHRRRHAPSGCSGPTSMAARASAAVGERSGEPPFQLTMRGRPGNHGALGQLVSLSASTPSAGPVADGPAGPGAVLGARSGSRRAR